MPLPVSGIDPLEMLSAPSIDTATLLPPEEDFDGLLDHALVAVQLMSSDEWTDFNEHDPGVTILEALCYTLSDVGYRINHPIEDIIASSAATHGLTAHDMAFYTAEQIFPTAPVTLDDMRTLILEDFPQISGVTFAPQRANRQIVDVFVHPPLDPDQSAPTPQSAKVKADRITKISALLQANRPLGIVWGHIREPPLDGFVMKAIIDIGDDGGDPNQIAAEILQAAATATAPVASFTDIALGVDEGVEMSKLLDGTGPRFGMARIDPQEREDAAFGSVSVRNAVAQLPSVRRVTQMDVSQSVGNVRPAFTATAHTSTQSTFASAPAVDDDALAQMQLTRLGTSVRLDPVAVRAALSARLAEQTFKHIYDEAALKQSTATNIPLGRRTRNLARYRSLQFLFPQIYGLGRLGLTDPLRDGERAQRLAQIKQLKGYLMFFEQIIANSLSQLNGLAPLLSSAALQNSYFPQVLASKTTSTDVAPDTAELLGQGSGEGWAHEYRAKLDHISGGIDDADPRLNRAANHMLARFGVSFDDSLRLSLDQDLQTNPDAAYTRLLDDKRTFLRDMVPLSRNRGLGTNIKKPSDASAFESAARLRTGYSGGMVVIEHSLIAPAEPQIVQAVALSCDAPFSVTGLLSEPVNRYELPNILSRLRQAATDKFAWRVLRQPDYSVVLELRVDDSPSLIIYDRFHSEQHAYSARDLLMRQDIHLKETLFPKTFYGAAMTCVLCTDGVDMAEQRFVTQDIMTQAPAHLAVTAAWSSLFDFGVIDREYAAQLATPKLARATLVEAVQMLWVSQALARIHRPADKVAA